MVKGSGLYKNKEFDFEGPITIKSQWNLTLQNDTIPMEFNYNELQWIEAPFIAEMDYEQFKADGLEYAPGEFPHKVRTPEDQLVDPRHELLFSIEHALVDARHNIKRSYFEGHLDNWAKYWVSVSKKTNFDTSTQQYNFEWPHLQKGNFPASMMKVFPLDILLAQAPLFKFVQFVSKVNIDGDFMEFQITPQHFNLLSEQGQKALKPIKGGFQGENKVPGKSVLFQTLIDDNLFNGLFSKLTSFEKKFAMREVLKKIPGAFSDSIAPVMDMLTIGNIGKVMSDFAEEYAPEKQIDLVLSPSFKVFQEGVPNSLQEL